MRVFILLSLVWTPLVYGQGISCGAGTILVGGACLGEDEAFEACQDLVSQTQQPSITTDDNNLIFTPGVNGHVGYNVHGETVMLDEIPAQLREYTDASFNTLNMGYQLCQGALEAATNAQLEGLQTRMSTLESSSTTAQGAISSTQTAITALEGDLQDVSADVSALQENADVEDLQVSGDAQVGGRLAAGGGVQIGSTQSCDSDAAGTLRWHDGSVQVCDGSEFANIYTDPCVGVECGDHGTCAAGFCNCDDGYSGDACDEEVLGSESAPGSSCKAIFESGQEADGTYFVRPGGSGPAVEVLCDMSTDGGGWTMCASQNFGANSRFLGRSQLRGTSGSLNSNQWSRDCATLMNRQGGMVEFMLKGSAANEWAWIYPFNTNQFYERLHGNRDGSCSDTRITQCKGSNTGDVQGVNKRTACHHSGGHRTSDHYFIWQVADSTNHNVLMEIGQGDANHPVLIRPDCGGSSWAGGCNRPGGSFPYQSRNYCGSGRVYGTVTVAYRER